MFFKKENNYFDMLVGMVDYSCQSAEILHSTLVNFKTDNLEEKINTLHELEHTGDILNHELIRKLLKEFITPIEREDIINLAQEIDDVTDTIEDVLLRIYMFNITSIREEALAFSTVIVQCCNALKLAMENFYNFQKSPAVQHNIVEINRLEEEGDKLYVQAIRNLYTTSTDPIEILAWTHTFDRLEKCCDACEHVSNVIETIIMKNS